MKVEKKSQVVTYRVELTKDEWMQIRTALASAASDGRLGRQEKEKHDALWNKMVDET